MACSRVTFTFTGTFNSAQQLKAKTCQPNRRFITVHTGWKTYVHTVMNGEYEGDSPLEGHSQGERIILKCTCNVISGTEVRSRNNCCRGKAISIAYSE